MRAVSMGKKRTIHPYLISIELLISTEDSMAGSGSDVLIIPGGVGESGDDR
jgi:hypothetical protein